MEFGISSMVAPLRDVLVQAPGPAFATAFDDPSHGFLYPVDFEVAVEEHRAFVDLLRSLGANVHLLGDEASGPDAVYQYDPSLVTQDGAILLRSGKPSRRGEERAQEKWYRSRDIPIVGAIEPPGTMDGGDVFWLDEGTICVGRTLRTNQAGIDQFKSMVSGEIAVFDVPFAAGPDACLHLLSVISPVSEAKVVVELERLPAGLYQMCVDRDMELIPVPPEEISSLGCNVLAVRPGVVVMVEGNPNTQSRLEASGVEVHTFVGDQICINGSGGPTCLTRPIFRST